jgi:hypothetical protein
MQLCLTLEHRFLQTPDKKIWTITQCPYSFYREYLQVFDQVRVISRVFPVSQAEPNFLPVEGPGVEFYAMPGYKGPYGFLAQFASVRTKAKHAVPSGSAVILRVHSQVANSVEGWLTRRDIPYSLEVTADPYDVLSPAANHRSTVLHAAAAEAMSACPGRVVCYPGISAKKVSARTGRKWVAILQQ